MTVGGSETAVDPELRRHVIRKIKLPPQPPLGAAGLCVAHPSDTSRESRATRLVAGRRMAMSIQIP